MNRYYIIITIITLLAVTAQIVVAEDDLRIYQKAEGYWDDGRYLEASEAFKSLLSNGSIRGEKAAFAYALSQEKAEHFDEAKQGYLYFMTHYPNSEYVVEAHEKLINLLIQDGDYAQAEYFLHTLSSKDLGSDREEQKAILIIFCYLRLTQYSNAEKSINKYISKYPNSARIPELRLWLAWYYIKLNDIKRAEAEYTSVINSGNNEEAVNNAKVSLVELLISNGRISEAIKYMLELFEQGYLYNNAELLWLANYLAEIRELAVATEVLNKIIEKSESAMFQAIAIKDLAQVQVEDRKLHDALSNFPLVRKALLSSNSTVAKVEILSEITDYSNAQTLRKIGSIDSANAILSKLTPDVYEPLYYKILYEQGLVALRMGRVEVAAKKLLQVGILAKDPDLAGKALLGCYEASKVMDNSKLMKVCLEELSGKNEGSYGRLYPNSPYTAQGYEIMHSAK